MKRIACAILVALVLGSLSCKPRASESGAPKFERVVPKAEGVPSDTSGGSEQAPAVDLAPLKAAVDASPDDPTARFGYMVGLRRAGRFVDALDQARILAKMKGDNPFVSVAHLNFSEIVLDDLPQGTELQSGLVKEAMDGLWIALGWEPESVPAHLALGRLALLAKDDNKALHHLSIALTVTEIGYQLRTDMAEIYLKRGDKGKARAHLEVARDLAEKAKDAPALRRIRALLRETS